MQENNNSRKEYIAALKKAAGAVAIHGIAAVVLNKTPDMGLPELMTPAGISLLTSGIPTAEEIRRFLTDSRESIGAATARVSQKLYGVAIIRRFVETNTHDLAPTSPEVRIDLLEQSERIARLPTKRLAPQVQKDQDMIISRRASNIIRDTASREKLREKGGTERIEQVRKLKDSAINRNRLRVK